MRRKGFFYILTSDKRAPGQQKRFQKQLPQLERENLLGCCKLCETGGLLMARVEFILPWTFLVDVEVPPRVSLLRHPTFLDAQEEEVTAMY